MTNNLIHVESQSTVSFRIPVYDVLSQSYLFAKIVIIQIGLN